VLAADSCDDGWVFDGDKSCFTTLHDYVTQAEAQAACESVGSNLAVPTNSYVADVMVCKKNFRMFECF